MQQIPDVKLHRTNLLSTNISWVHTMCVNSRKQLCVQGKVINKDYYIRWFDRNNGSLIKQIKCQCQHGKLFAGYVCEHPVNPDVIIETCPECSKIKSYNMNTGESADIYTKAAIKSICTGPAGSILGADWKRLIMQFRWKDDCEELEPFHSVKISTRDVRYMCYVDHSDAVVLSCWYPDRLCAVKLSDSSTLWEFNQQINGTCIKPCGLCLDTDGRIYVAAWNSGVITIDSRNGELLEHLIEDVILCHDICWTSSQPQLILLRDFPSTQICTFNVRQ